MAEKELITFTHLEAVLDEYADAAVRIYAENVAKEGANASGDLVNFLRGEVLTNQGGYEVTLQLNHYWEFLEGGTKGKEYPNALCKQHRPPISAICRWVEIKPILPRPATAKRKAQSLDSLAWAIAKSIERNGIRPRPILATTIKELNEQYLQRLQDALALDTQGYIHLMLGEVRSLPAIETKL